MPVHYGETSGIRVECTIPAPGARSTEHFLVWASASALDAGDQSPLKSSVSGRLDRTAEFGSDRRPGPLPVRLICEPPPPRSGHARKARPAGEVRSAGRSLAPIRRIGTTGPPPKEQVATMGPVPQGSFWVHMRDTQSAWGRPAFLCARPAGGSPWAKRHGSILRESWEGLVCR
jgi:hypothetical protein